MHREELAGTYALLRRLLREYGRAYLPAYIAAFVLMGLVAACTSLTAWMMRDVINLIFVDKSRHALFYIPVAIVAIFAVKGIASYLQETTLGRIGNGLIADAQKRMFNHLLKMDVAFYQRYPSSELITRMTRNAESVRDMLNTVAVAIGRDLLTVFGLVSVMVLQDPLMSVIALASAPLATFGVRGLINHVRQAAASEIHSSASIVAAVRETSQGIRLVKSFQLEGPLRNRTFTAIEAVERLVNRLIAVQARVNPLLEALAGVTIASVVLYAGWRNLSYGDTPGQFFAFITALLLAADPVRRLSRVPLQLVGAGIGVRMMYEILDAPPVEQEVVGARQLDIGAGEVRFEQVDFAYAANVPVLNDLTFIAPAGKTTALVGLSGAGKTTIFNLMQRFWAPNAGRVLIDGQSIMDVSISSLREGIAFVSQDAFLFEGTAKDNIRAGRQDATDAMIIAAAKVAQADEFIRALPQGYDASVGELGSGISGGQRQRISIARAVLKNAPIILLDEPTSALDSETEESIQRALSELTRGKTTIVIAHRLATILHSDIIHVVDNGRVVESGTHAELIEKGGVYARLHRLQFGDVALAQQVESSKAAAE
jgi:subfamily B ATP-binding cassette protein MsbA